MNIPHLLLSLFAALSLPTPASSSANGLLYKCDAAKLKAEDMCYFVPTGSETMGPHNIDRSVAEAGFRQVSDASGSPLRVSPKPWTQGDKLTKSANLLADDLIAYAEIFELVAPLRNAMMYDPKSLSADATRWGVLTKSLVDCKIKEKDTTMEKGGRTMNVYSVAGVYALLKKAGGVDTHHPILQFLEEGAIELVCLAVPEMKMDHCDKVRKANAVTTEPSTCWHQAYKGMYGSLPRTKGTGSTADPASTTAGTASTTTAATVVTSAVSAGSGMAPGVLSLCVGALLARWLR